jgi:hypothetical protein
MRGVIVQSDSQAAKSGTRGRPCRPVLFIRRPARLNQYLLSFEVWVGVGIPLAAAELALDDFMLGF